MINESIDNFGFVMRSLARFPDSPPGILSLMSFKAIDALGAVSNDNFGMADSDVWEGCYTGAMALFIYLNGPSNTGLINNVMQLAQKRNFKDACLLLIPVIKTHPKIIENLEILVPKIHGV